MPRLPRCAPGDNLRLLALQPQHAVFHRLQPLIDDQQRPFDLGVEREQLLDLSGDLPQPANRRECHVYVAMRVVRSRASSSSMVCFALGISTSRWAMMRSIS